MMSKAESIAKQLHFNMTFALILDGSVLGIIEQLKADKTPEMKIEITLLQKIYEKFMEAKPTIEQLQNRGRQIQYAQKN